MTKSGSVLTLLDRKKSIRIRIFWSFLTSFLLAFVAATVVPSGDMTHKIGSTFSVIITFAVFIILFMLFFFLLTRRIVRNMQTLAEGLVTIANGDLNYRVPLVGQDELGTVAQNINYMAEQLQSMMERERLLELSKMELITHVSHDLRTPLTSIVGYLNLLKNDDYKNIEEHKRYIHNAYNKTQQLNKLIDDLFDYTRLSSGDVRLTLQTIDLRSLVEQMATEVEPIAQENLLAVKLTGPETPLFVHVDAEKLVRAIDNLLMNALKFSLKPGEIALHLESREDAVLLTVENKGKPITPEQEIRLFERFYKAEPSRRDREMPPGAGLGLSIASHIVELHGGKMSYIHREGHFTFAMELPAALS
ncbi:ATP-binding protein [Paenibacillus sp. GCM10027627]|uniref:HAMP domain-containing sensor histidine kinase n=1 Tax=unclassified Paenibacillus TaxID=185978 RepID=UPI00362EB9A3